MKNASLCISFCILLFLLLFSVLTIPERKKEEPPTYKKEIRVLNHLTGEIKKMDIEEYVVRCMESEMPASFSDEALKAQAVAIRSYTLCKTQKQAEAHKDADVCTDFNHCAAFLQDETTISAENREKHTKAAQATRGEILTYDNQAVTAVFHAISSGKTENAEDVWGGSVPYLVSVDSSEDKTAPGYETVVKVSESEIKEKLNVENVKIGDIKYTEGGSVAEVSIGNKVFKGTTLRTAFGLRSAAFTIMPDAGGISFTVHGYGHGVGMSQRGADACAKKGMKYTEILAKYYPGTTLSRVY